MINFLFINFLLKSIMMASISTEGNFQIETEGVKGSRLFFSDIFSALLRKNEDYVFRYQGFD